MVITMDFDSINPGSNPGRTCQLTIAQLVERGTVIDFCWISLGRWFESGW